MDILNKFWENYRQLPKNERWAFIRQCIDFEGRANLRTIVYPDDNSSRPGFDVNLAEGAAGEIWIQNALFVAEVKTDIKAGETGKVAIEVECGGSPSGITSTVAPFWAHVLGGSQFTNPETGDYEVAVIIATSRLRRIIQGEYRLPGGDNGRATNVIMPALKLLRQNKDIVKQGTPSQIVMFGWDL